MEGTGVYPGALRHFGLNWPLHASAPMNHPLPPETSLEPLAPGLRLPESDRKEFSAEALAEIQAIMAKYPEKLAATLPALHIAQREFGFVSLAAMKAVAKAIGIPEGHVFGVATFYTMYQKAPGRVSTTSRSAPTSAAPCAVPRSSWRRSARRRA